MYIKFSLKKLLKYFFFILNLQKLSEYHEEIWVENNMKMIHYICKLNCIENRTMKMKAASRPSAFIKIIKKKKTAYTKQISNKAIAMNIYCNFSEL